MGRSSHAHSTRDSSRQHHKVYQQKAIKSIAASHSPQFTLMHVDVSRAYFHTKAQRPVLVKLPAENC